MNPRDLALFVTVSLFLIASLLGCVGAEVLYEANPTSWDNKFETSSAIIYVHPYSGANSSAYGQTFRTSWNGSTVDYVDIWLVRAGNPNAIWGAALYTASGSVGYQTPDTELEVSSTTFNISSLTVSVPTAVRFEFNTTTLYTETDYCFYVYEVSEVTADASHYAAIYYTQCSTTVGYAYYGNAFKWQSGAWNTISSFDCGIRVFGTGGVYCEYINDYDYTVNYFEDQTTVATSPDWLDRPVNLFVIAIAVVIIGLIILKWIL